MNYVINTSTNPVGDITLGQMLPENPQDLGILCQISFTEDEEIYEETFIFNGPKALWAFLTMIPSFLTKEISESGSADAYYDYFPALMEQVRDFLTQAQFITQEKFSRNSYEERIAANALTFCIDFFNAMLVHQGEEGISNPNSFFCSNLEKI